MTAVRTVCVRACVRARRSTMDGSTAVVLISAAMFLGSFCLGLIPLLVKLSESWRNPIKALLISLCPRKFRAKTASEISSFLRVLDDLRRKKLQFVSLLGAGLLCGTALAVIIPEGVELLEDAWGGLLVSQSSSSSLCGVCMIPPDTVAHRLDRANCSCPSPGPAPPCTRAESRENSSGLGPSAGTGSGRGVPPHFFIGVSLVVGFILMFIVDQISSYCSVHGKLIPNQASRMKVAMPASVQTFGSVPAVYTYVTDSALSVTADPRTGMSSSTSITATLGLVIHAAADGVALGAAAASSQITVQVIVFFAVILHKAPAAFGLVSFLMHAGLERRQIQTHLLAFSVAAPLLAISTYFILSATGGSSQHRLGATGIGMLFSAGTFLYVATVHVLPEISSRGHHHSGTGPYPQGGLGVLESLTLIAGAGLPVLLALGLHDG
ncbi:zinc transporter ZIP9-like [Scleropages formosus]|uniref:Zinc transporter ZIP9 n=1 Tax=Scleropages formosus TaxID=113540 RepID=A0A0P7TZ05_SCLFO|nr:zinc transporter ZIP9-like [Scleropages formosus]